MVATARHLRIRIGMLIVIAVFTCVQTTASADSPDVVNATYRVERHKDRLDILAELQLRNPDEESDSLALDLGGLTLMSAELNNKPAVIHRDDKRESVVHVVAGSTKKSTLRLRLSTGLTVIGKDRAAVIPVVATAPATLKVAVPAGEFLEVNGQRPRRKTAINLSANYDVPIGNRPRIALRFTTGAAMRTTDAVTLATSRIEIDAARSAARWKSETTLHVVGKRLQTQRIIVPGRLKIANVRAEGLRGWTLAEAEDDDGETTVTLQFRHPFTGKRNIQLAGIVGMDAEDFWSVPTLKFAGADAHSGRIVLRSPRSLGLRVGEIAGVSERVLSKQSGNVVPVSAKKDTTDSTTRLLGFDFWRQDFELPLAIPKKRTPLTAEANTQLAVKGGRAMLHFQAEIKSKALPRRLRVALPAGWSGLLVRANGRPVRWELQPVEAGVQRMVVSLTGVDAKSIRLEIRASQQLESDDDGGPKEVLLPLVRLLDAATMTGRVRVLGNDTNHLTATGVKKLEAVAPNDDATRLAYHYTLRATDRTGFQGTLKVQPRRRKTLAESLALFRIAGNRLQSEHDVRFRPSEGGLRTLTIAVDAAEPADVAFRWHGSNSRMTAIRTTPNEQRWLVSFYPPLQQPGVLSVNVSSKIKDPSAVRPHRVRIAEVETGAERIVLLSRSDQHLMLRARKGEKTYHLNRINLQEMPAWARKFVVAIDEADHISGIFQSPPQGYEVRIAARVPQTVGSPAAVERLDLHSRMTTAGVLQTTAMILVTGERPGRLQVSLPDGAQLKQLSMNDERVPLARTSGGEFLLPRSAIRRSRNRLKVEYEMTVDRLSGLGEVHVGTPGIHRLSTTGTTESLPVAESTWTLWMPSGVKVVGAGGTFESLDALDSISWLKAGLPFETKRGRTFHFRHVAGSGESPSLRLTYAEAAGGLRLRLAVLLAVVLVLWRLRKIPLRYRASGAVATGVGAAVLTLWAPAASGPCLDGLFLGTIFGAATWGLPAVGASLRRLPGRWPSNRVWLGKRQPTVAGLLAAFTFMHCCSAVLSAAEQATVASARYDIELTSSADGNRQLADVTAKYRIHSASKSPATVALPLGSIALQTARVDGKSVTTHWNQVGKNNDKQLTARIPTAGWSELELKFTLPVVVKGSQRLIQLPTRPTTIATASLQLNDDRWSLRIDGHTGLWRRISDDAGVRYEFPIERTRGVTIELSPKSSRPVERPRIEVRTATDIEINDHGVLQRDQFLLTVRDGVMRDWTFAIPAGRKLLAIDGANVAGWEMHKTGDGRSVRVQFRRAVRSTTDLSFQTYRPVRISSEPVQLALHRVTPTDARAVDETVAYSAHTDFALTESTTQHARRISPARLVKIGASARAIKFAYRLTKPESTITLKVSRPGSVVNARAKHTAFVRPKEIELATRMQFEIDGPPRSNFTIFLPEGFALKSLTGDNNAGWAFGEEGTMLNVTFPKPQTGLVAVDLRGSYRRNPASPTAEISIPSPMSIARLENTLTVRAASVYDISPGETDTWTRIETGAGGRQTLTYRSKELEAIPLGIRLTPKSGSITATSATVIQPTRDDVQFTFILRWNGLPGKTRMVAFTVPAWLSPHLNITAGRRQTIQRDPRTSAGDKPQRWFVTRFGESKEDVVVTARATLQWSAVRDRGITVPRIAQERPKNPLTTDDLTEIEFTRIENTRRFVAIAGDAGIRLSAPARQPGQRISPVDFPGRLLLPQGLSRRIAASGRAFELDRRRDPVTWRRDDRPQPVDANAVTQANLTTTIHRDGGYRTTARYHVRNANREYLGVIVPSEFESPLFHVNGRVTQPFAETNDDGKLALIPITRNSGGESITVEITWTGRLDDLSSGAVSLPAPRIVSHRQDPRNGWTVGGTRWTVRLPHGLTAKPKLDPQLTNLAVGVTPERGRVLTFEKPGGEPKLTLAIHSTETAGRNWSILASLVWLISGTIGCMAIHRLRRRS